MRAGLPSCRNWVKLLVSSASGRGGLLSLSGSVRLDRRASKNIALAGFCPALFSWWSVDNRHIRLVSGLSNPASVTKYEWLCVCQSNRVCMCECVRGCADAYACVCLCVCVCHACVRVSFCACVYVVREQEEPRLRERVR